MWNSAERVFPNHSHSFNRLSRYGVFHREPLNQLIHFFGVPLLVQTLFIFMGHLPLARLQIKGLPGMPPPYVTWATVYLLGSWRFISPSTCSER
jgi:hypothetical protein